MYRVFTDNCKKSNGLYCITESISHKFLKLLYLDYYSWTYITTNFQYHSDSFNIRNVSQKNQAFSHQQNIWTVTNYGKFKSSIALRREFRKYLKLSPRQLLHSYAFSRVIDRFMASGDVSPFKLPGPPRTKIIEENIDTVRTLIEEKPNSTISLLTPTSNWFLQKI